MTTPDERAFDRRKAREGAAQIAALEAAADTEADQLRRKVDNLTVALATCIKALLMVERTGTGHGIVTLARQHANTLHKSVTGKEVTLG